MSKLKIEKQIRIEVSGEEARAILAEHVRKVMASEGYTLNYERAISEDSFPDMLYIGKALEK